MIPKIIHQTWRHKNLKNDCFHACAESVKSRHSDYKYVFHTDEESRQIVKDDFLDFLGVYDSMSPVERADLFRYLIVYRDGGIYLDIDCYCVRKFDDLIEGEDFVAGYEQGWEQDGLLRYTQWAFAAKPEHPVLLESAYECKQNHLKSPELWTLKKTGPIMWTGVINRLKDEYNLKLGGQSWFGSRVYGVNSKNTVPPRERKCIIKNINKHSIKEKEIYVIHLFYGSWHKSKKTNMQIISEIRAIEHMLK